MIDLNKFVSEKTISAPVINNEFIFSGKRYKVSDCQDDWYNIIISGNTAIIDKPINVETCKRCKSKKIRGYAYNNNFIFFNFDEGRRKTGKEVMVPLLLNKSNSFSPVVAVIWEDNKLYYFSPNYLDFFTGQVKYHIEEAKNLDLLSGLTPELRTLALFHTLESERLEEEKKELEAEELRKTLQGRLILSFRRVGAELLRYSVNGNRIVCDWRIGSQEFNSVLDRESFRVLEAGYCLSGDDKHHTLHSLVVLARDYDKDGLIYKTRE